MANLQQLKSRIESVEKTASITKAMYQIASSKLVSTQDNYKKYQVFKKTFDEVMDTVISGFDTHPYMAKKDASKHKLYILISADRGLVGSYHHNLFKFFLNDIEHQDKSFLHILAIGKKAYTFAKKHQIELINERIIPNYDQISELTYPKYMSNIVEQFLNNSIGEIVVYSNHFVNNMSQKPISEVLLPLKPKEKSENFNKNLMIYEGGRHKVLSEIMLIYMQSRTYGLLLDAKLSEFSSRIMAMKSATDNASEALDKLKLKYNQARQHKITNDLLDISNSKL